MRRIKSKISNINNLTIEQFNKLYPIGTKVNYYPIYTNADDYLETETTSPAWKLASGIKVVCLKIGSGGYCFDNIQVIGNNEVNRWKFC